jgi:glycosyl transferase family 2
MSLTPRKTAAVSVVIPAYRAAATIGRAVASVLAQTFPVAEILVIDDGSPDDLAAELAPFGERIMLIRQENGGAASARNLGIERATGDFIAFLDADDYWEPRRLECQLQLFQQHPGLGLVAGQYFNQPPGGERALALTRQAHWFDRLLSLNGERAFTVATIVWTSTTLVRRQVLADERFVSGLEPAEDRDLWARLVKRAPCYLSSEPLATAVLIPASLSRSSIIRDCTNMLRVVERQRATLGPVASRMWTAHTYYRWGACEPSPAAALAKLVRSWWLWPLPFRRELVIVRHARAKAAAVNLLRFAGLRKQADAS